MERVMKHSHARRTLRQRVGGKVYPRDQISSQIHDGTDDRERESSDGKMRIVPIVSEQVERVQEPIDLRKRYGCPWHHRKHTRIVERGGRQHHHHHGRHEQRDGHDVDGKQRECAVNEHGNDRHSAGNDYLTRRGPGEQAGVGTQRDVGTVTSGPTCAVDAVHDPITNHVAPPGVQRRQRQEARNVADADQSCLRKQLNGRTRSANQSPVMWYHHTRLTQRQICN